MVVSLIRKILFSTYKVLPVNIRYFISQLFTDKFSVGMVAFVIKNNEILLLKHSYQNSWGLPGGWMQKGEELTQTMEREIQEELNILAKVVDIFEIKSVLKRPIIDVAVVCHYVSGKIKEDQVEVEKATFFPIDALPDNIISTHRPYLERYLKHFKAKGEGTT